MSRIFSALDHRGALAPLNESGSDDAGWDDAIVSTMQAIGGSALATVSYRDTGVSMLAMAPNDVLSVFTQLPHRWNRGQVRPHLHVIAAQVPAAPRVVKISVKYVWALTNAALPANSGWTTLPTIDYAVVPGDEYLEKILALGTLTPPAAAKESAILVMQVSRVAAGDTYNDGAAANLVLLSIDTHYQAEKLGTYPELPVA
jgi:hypothetical protein